MPGEGALDALMAVIPGALSYAAAALAGLGILYLLLAIIMMRRLAMRPLAGAADGAPSVTILKPLHGAEPDLAINLDSFVRQTYPGPVQIVFGVQRPDDPAIALVEALQAAWPEHDIELVQDTRLYGANRKISNLMNMLPLARHDVIVLADSDMRVGPDYVAGLVRHLAEPGVGAVSCPYYGITGDSLWSRLAGLSIDTHFLPGVAMGAGLRIAHPCMGSTIALTRATLDRVGGFTPLANELADDHALGARVRALGLDVRVTRFAIGHVCPERRWGDLVTQELRWLRTIRQVARSGHLGSLVTHPVVFAALALVLQPSLTAFGLVGVALGARTGLCLAVERVFGLKPHPYWLVPARDLLSFALFIASFFGRGVSWRGYRYEAARGGALLSKARPDLL